MWIFLNTGIEILTCLLERKIIQTTIRKQKQRKNPQYVTTLKYKN